MRTMAEPPPDARHERSERCERCALCSKQPRPGQVFKRCGLCHDVAYCDRTCQKADWHVFHRAKCKGVPNKKTSSHEVARLPSIVEASPRQETGPTVELPRSATPSPLGTPSTSTPELPSAPVDLNSEEAQRAIAQWLSEERADATPLSGSRDEVTSSQRSPSESRLLPNQLEGLTVSQIIGLFGRSVPRIDVYGSSKDIDEHDAIRAKARFVGNRGHLSDEPHALAVSPPAVKDVLRRLTTMAPDPPLGSKENGVCALDQTP